MPKPKVLVVGGTNSGVGKTSFALGLIAALRRKDVVVQSFKVGPDFVDPLHHTAATSRPTVNLDGWLLDKDACLSAFWEAADGCDVAVVEGVMGLFDGAEDSSDSGSTAQIAKWLGAPIVLIIDSSTIARSIAAVIKGCQTFDPELSIPAVVLNKVSSPLQTKSLSDAIAAAKLGVTVVGGMPKDELLDILDGSDKSTLSLPSMELPPGHINMLADAVETHIQVDRLLELAATLEPPIADIPRHLPEHRVKLGLAFDSAFCFYHHRNLVILEAAGFELVRFSPMEDPCPPPGVAALYLGGGHPEHYCGALSSNGPMLAAIRAFCDGGGPVFAEAAGLMYLSQSIQLPSSVTCPMAGVFSFRTRLTTEDPHAGYVTVTPSPSCPLLPPGVPIRGHYHHRSEIIEEHILSGLTSTSGPTPRLPQPPRTHQYTFSAHIAGPGGGQIQEGYTYKSVLASYVHLQLASAPEAATCFARRAADVDVDALHSDVAAAVARWQQQAAAAAAPLLHAAQAHAHPQLHHHHHHGGPAHAHHHAHHHRSHSNASGALSYAALDRLHAHTLSDSASLGDLRSGAATPATRSPTPSEDNFARLLAHHHTQSCTDLTRHSDFHPAVPANGAHSFPAPANGSFQYPSLTMPPRGRSADALSTSSNSSSLPHLTSPHDPPSLPPPEKKLHLSLPPIHLHPDPSNSDTSSKLSDPPSSTTPSDPATQLTPSKLTAHTHTKLIGIACPLTRPTKPPLAPPPLPTTSQDIAERIHRSHSASTSSSPTSGPHPFQPPSFPTRPSFDHLPTRRPSSDHPLARHYTPNGTNDLIASFSPAATEALLAMGLSPRLIGVTDCCDCPPDPRTPKALVCAMEKPPLRTWWAANALSAGPDWPPAPTPIPTGPSGSFAVDEDFLREEQPGLVVMQDPGGCYCPDKETVQRALQRSGLLRAESSTCVLQLRSHTLSDVLESLLVLGRAAGTAEAAQLLADRLRARLRRVAALAAVQPSPLRVLCLVGIAPLVPGGGWIPEMLALAGAAELPLESAATCNPAARPDELSWDDIRALAPDVLLICHPYQRMEQTLAQVAHLAGQPGWWALPAVRNGQVYVLHPSLAARPGPRLVDGVEVMARILHPSAAVKRAAPGSVLRLALQGGQRCRQKLLPNYFLPFL